MSAFVPSSLDEVNRHAMAEVKADLERVQQLGFVGTWVTHPALVPVAHAVFILESSAIHSTTPAEADGRLHNSQRTGPEEEEEAARDLLRIVEHGPITELGMRNNIRVGLHHLAYWLAGRGAVPIHNQMEDTATAELARAQLWQWLRHRVKLDDGRLCTPELFDTLLHEEIRSLPYALSDKPDALRQLTQATRLFKQLVISMEFEEFLTLPAYELMLIDEQGVNKGLKQVSQRTVQSG
jgi:malate synthase